MYMILCLISTLQVSRDIFSLVYRIWAPHLPLNSFRVCFPKYSRVQKSPSPPSAQGKKFKARDSLGTLIVGVCNAYTCIWISEGTAF
jgi:hypothetical protein